MPPEYSVHSLSACGSKSTRSSTSSARARHSRRGTWYSAASISTHSRPVSSPRHATSCITWPMRRRTSPGSRMTSNPQTRAVPSFGASSVVSMRIVVVLPAPFGPSSPKTSPRSTRRSRQSTARCAPKLRTNPCASMTAVTCGSCEHHSHDVYVMFGYGPTLRSDASGRLVRMLPPRQPCTPPSGIMRARYSRGVTPVNSRKSWLKCAWS